MQFLHKSTRLSCDLGRAFRFLTAPVMFEKWSASKPVINLKKGGEYTLNMNLEAQGIEFNTAGTQIYEYEREKTLQLQWKDSLHPNESYDMTIKFMSCRSDTEYCSELHLIFKNCARALNNDELKVYDTLFTTLLEMLRQYQNKDWVIEDKDLSMSWLRGKGL